MHRCIVGGIAQFRWYSDLSARNQFARIDWITQKPGERAPEAYVIVIVERGGSFHAEKNYVNDDKHNGLAVQEWMMNAMNDGSPFGVIQFNSCTKHSLLNLGIRRVTVTSIKR